MNTYTQTVDNVEKYLDYLHIHAAESVVRPTSDLKSVKIANECAAEQERNFRAFEPLMRKICKTPKQEYAQYHWLFWMAVANTHRNYVARMLRYVKSSDFFAGNHNCELYNIILESYESEMEKARSRSEYYRFMFLCTEHRALKQSLGTQKLNTSQTEKYIKNYFDKNAPDDAWKISNKIKSIRGNIRKITRQK